jgi:hypothetical protein
LTVIFYIIFHFLQEGNEPMVLEPSEPGQGHPLQALLQRGANFNPVVDIPPDADDETMVELAIALSLQDQVNFDVPIFWGWGHMGT